MNNGSPLISSSRDGSSPITVPNNDGSSNRVTGGNDNGSNPHVHDASSNSPPVFDLSSVLSTDISYSFVGSASLLVDVSVNIQDFSQNVFFVAYDSSCVDMSYIDVSNTSVHITDISSIVVIDGSGYNIVTEDGFTTDGSYITQTIFNSDDPSFNVQITEVLTETFSTYDDDSSMNKLNYSLMEQIKSYASEIKCSDFHGKGTIDDYTELFKAASKIANETKQMELNVEIDGFNEFSSAADDLSDLFNGFIIKIQNVNIITDVTFLQSIVNALSKIVNLSKIFKKFKEVVFATSQVQIPKSTHDTAVILNGVMNEINCAVEHIQYFVSPSDVSLNDAELSQAEKNMISKSVETINTWNILSENGISIAMTNNPDIKFIQQSNQNLKQTSRTLTNATNKLKQKLAQFNIMC